MHSEIEGRLIQKLKAREENTLLRKLSKKQGLVDFCSNDYLGLSRNQELISKIQFASQESNGLKLGSGGSRLLAGNSELAEQLESKLTLIHESESALLFNSGYSANLSIFSSIPQKGDTIIYDELSHACIKDGARLSFANRLSFKHNDLEDLKKKIEKASGNIFVAVESIYSMDGDEAPLRELVEMIKEYEFNLIVDEAHSTGVRGANGGGLCLELGIHENVFARIHTFGKGIGAHGACIAGSEVLKQYLINFARPFIFTTALPDHNLITIRESYDCISRNPDLLNQLNHKIKLFNSLIKVPKIESNSAIQAILFSGNERVRLVSNNINKQGYDVRPILSPTVKAGGERIRVCLHTFNSDEQIKELAELLNRSN